MIFRSYPRHFVYYVRRLWGLFQSFILVGSHSVYVYYAGSGLIFGVWFQWQLTFRAFAMLFWSTWFVWCSQWSLTVLLEGFSLGRVTWCLWVGGRESPVHGNERFPGSGTFVVGSSLLVPSGCPVSPSKWEVSGPAGRQTASPGYLSVGIPIHCPCWWYQTHPVLSTGL